MAKLLFSDEPCACENCGAAPKDGPDQTEVRIGSAPMTMTYDFCSLSCLVKFLAGSRALSGGG